MLQYGSKVEWDGDDVGWFPTYDHEMWILRKETIDAKVAEIMATKPVEIRFYSVSLGGGDGLSRIPEID